MTTELLTTTEAAKRLKIQPQTMRAWRTTGYGPRFVRVGSSVRYQSSDLDAWLESRSVDPARPGGRS